MTIGNKILTLRMREKISQEELAFKLNVSRQAVSKWETDNALPSIDKVKLICEMFNLSIDDFLYSDSRVTSKKTENPKGGKYFGTDGFRGEANVDLTSEQAYKVGRFLGWYFSFVEKSNSSSGRAKIVVGKDTRRSSYMLEYSIIAGITASGADAYMLHVTTTPSVSYVTRQDEFDAGIMITASHNAYQDNGIKIINRFGEKMEDKVITLIESYLDGDLSKLGIIGPDIPFAKKDKIGEICDCVSGRNRYLGYLISIASHSYKKLKIGLDCANGASWSLANALFSALGAQTMLIGAEPNGLNVNLDCGSTHLDKLVALVKQNHLDVGFAFDGDADRCLAVDENGNIVDGDAIIYILAKRLKDRGILTQDTIVATVMSNSGLVKSLEDIGIKTIRTQVGDRYVYECMQEGNYGIGGEQSGHIILKKYATTGDGLLTAIMLLEEICDRKSSLSKLTESIMLYPQYTKNVKVKDKDLVMQDKNVLKARDEVDKLIDNKGRVLLRQSGTESVVRIMLECEKKELCFEYAEKIEKAIIDGGYTV